MIDLNELVELVATSYVRIFGEEPCEMIDYVPRRFVDEGYIKDIDAEVALEVLVFALYGEEVEAFIEVRPGFVRGLRSDEECETNYVHFADSNEELGAVEALVAIFYGLAPDVLPGQ